MRQIQGGPPPGQFTVSLHNYCADALKEHIDIINSINHNTEDAEERADNERLLKASLQRMEDLREMMKRWVREGWRL